MKKILILVFLLNITISVFSQECYITKQDKLTEDETETLQKIAKFHPDIKFVQNVTRQYVYVNEKYKLFQTTLNYNKDIDNFYFGEYIAYDVVILPNNRVIEYEFSAGTAFTEIGTINVWNDIIRNSFSFGTSHATTEVWINDKKVFSENKAIRQE